MMTWRIALMVAFVPATLAASSLLVACNDDVDTPPWYPNYTDSGYGGAKAKGGAGGAAGAAGSVAAAGTGGLNSAGGGGASAGSTGSEDAGEGGSAP